MTVPLDEIRKALDAAKHFDFSTIDNVHREVFEVCSNAPTWLRSLLEENERLSIALHTHESYDKTVTELYEETQQLREEMERARKAAKHWQDRYDQDADRLPNAITEADSLRSELAAKDKVLEWYANENNYTYPPHEDLTIVQEDYGERARSILSQYANAK